MIDQKQFEYKPRKGRPIEEAFIREVMILHEAGWSNVAIGKKMGRHNSNIQRLLAKLGSKSVIWDMKPSKQKDTKMRAKRATGIQAPEESEGQMRMSTGALPGKEIHEEIESPEQKIKRLERELSEACMERDLYKQIISVAEKKFEIQITKKAGTKQ